MNRKPATLRGTLTRAIILTVLAPLALGLGLFIGKQIADAAPTAASADVQTTPYVPGLDRMTAMTKRGECWGNDGRVHPIPTRVWLTAPYSGSGDVLYVLRGARAVERVFATGNWAKVARFCR